MPAVWLNSGLSQSLRPRPGCTVVHGSGGVRAQEQPMSQTISAVQRSSPGRMKWRLAGGAVVALLIGALWRAEDVPPIPSHPDVSLTGSAPVTFAPPSAGMADASTELVALKAELNTAAMAIDQPKVVESEGPVRTRPDYVSPMEWMGLQGVANQPTNALRESRMGDTMARIEAASRAAAQAVAQSGNAVVPVGSAPAATSAPAR